MVSYETFRNLVDKFKDIGVNFEPSQKIYNPIEFFLDRVTQKEYAHSLFIAHLFDPKGQHNANTAFLDSFIQALERNLQPVTLKSFNQIDWEKTQVFTEYYIKTNLTNTKEPVTGRIDILIKCCDKNGIWKNSIIIENKLNGADYGDNQLEKYRKAIQGEIGSGEIVVVCFQTDDRVTDGADIILTPIDISGFIEATDTFKDGNTADIIKCYTTYLKNISKNSMAENNANKLLPFLTGDDITKMKLIKEMYEHLPMTYASEFKNKITKKIETYRHTTSHPLPRIEKDDYYPGYVDIWQPQPYANPDLSIWLSIGFYHDEVRFYLVSKLPDVDRIQKYTESLGFSFSSASGGWRWYKSNNAILPTLLKYSKNKKNGGIPDFDEIINICEKYVNRLDISDVSWSESNK